MIVVATALAVAAIAVPSMAASGTATVKTRHGKLGTYLVDRNGMTLYYFERDDSGTKSTCNDACAGKRPPLAAADNAVATGDYTVITRNDGKKMWAYRYRPLYTSQKDAAPGDVNGDDPTQLWHVARPY